MEWRMFLQVNGKYGISTINGKKIADQVPYNTATNVVKNHNQEQPVPPLPSTPKKI